MVSWYWQVLIYLILGLVVFFSISIYQFLKYHLAWKFDRDWLQFRLNDIWQKSGIVEIQGGAQTGKTLLITLLTAHLKGRKWSNLPNTVPGWQELTLPILRQHRLGNYKGGIVGKNNVLLIDEPWNFFSKQELRKANLERDLSNILWFMSETSKTDWKIFYVQKLGAKLPDAFDLLAANKTATIRTLGLRSYCFWWGARYYYLDYEIIPNNGETTFAPTKYKKVIEKGKKVKKPKNISWWTRWFGKNNLQSIPVSESDFDYYDKTWNLDSNYAMNRLGSVAKKFKADGLTEGIKLGQSRRQGLREETESINYWKKNDPVRKKQMLYKGFTAAKEKGLWKPAVENIAEQEAELQKQLENGEITLEECKEGMEKLMNNRQKLSEVIAKTYPDQPEREPEKPAKKPSFKKGKDKKLPWENEEE